MFIASTYILGYWNTVFSYCVVVVFVLCGAAKKVLCDLTSSSELFYVVTYCFTKIEVIMP